MAYVFTSLLWRGENATQQFHGRGAWAPGLTGLRPLSPTPRGCGHGEQEAGNTDMLILMLSVFLQGGDPPNTKTTTGEIIASWKEKSSCQGSKRAASPHSNSRALKDGTGFRATAGTA